MKVCLLNDSFPPVIDGVANTVVNYANILTDCQLADVVVGTPKYKDADYSQYPFSVVPYMSLNVADFANGYRLGNPMAMRSINQLVEFEPDIIHSHCPFVSTLISRIVRKKTDAPVIFTYHTKFDYDIARAAHSKLIQKEAISMVVSNIESCDEVWVVSKGAGDNLKSLGYQGDYRVMTNGVDFAKGRIEPAIVREITKDYDLPEDVPVFLFVGRMMYYKGLPIIMDAMKILHEKNIDFRMVFIGGGADLDKLKASAEEYNIASKVFFTGPIYDRDILRAWNTRADLFLFPSVYDTNGIVVREAAACGLASVLIKDSCASEGITDARNGFLIDENAESMAALLEKVSSDLSYLHEIGQNAMDEIYISWEDSVKNAHRRYEEVIALKQEDKLPPKTHLKSDAFLNFCASIVNGTEKVISLPKTVITDVKSNLKSMDYFD